MAYAHDFIAGRHGVRIDVAMLKRHCGLFGGLSVLGLRATLLLKKKIMHWPGLEPRSASWGGSYTTIAV